MAPRPVPLLPLRSATRLRTARQAGMAYFIVLLALAVLTMLALVVVAVSQTELAIGTNEVVVQRSFYAADAGISARAAQALMEADYTSRQYDFPDVLTTPGLRLHHEVQVSPFYPILQTACDLCEINNAGEYSNQSYQRVTHAVTSVAIRRSGTDAQALAQKMVGAMVDVQPMRMPAEALLPLMDPDELAKIKF